MRSYHLTREQVRDFAQILSEGPWDRAWVDARLRLLPRALDAHAGVHPNSQAFEWQVHPDYQPRAGHDAETELRIAHGVHLPGSFCSAGDVPAP